MQKRKADIESILQTMDRSPQGQLYVLSKAKQAVESATDPNASAINAVVRKIKSKKGSLPASPDLTLRKTMTRLSATRKIETANQASTALISSEA
eukprot:CAMPEP_0170511664 /NCGR_PEP_ID=MMETSP0208-20121228/66429_1 /TAXON_ID=197538 /ORGANISM="Strombidium inclinatum, Strain S3" /LENGTH=94 /DNA_ID=CAMNT_0010795225 /DNA_START=1576 /DNA_END=1860 /DNA_ORIENTATION=-